MRARKEQIDYIRSFMAHLNMLAFSTFKFANSRGYDRARRAGKKWRGEIDHPGNQVACLPMRILVQKRHLPNWDMLLPPIGTSSP